MFYTSLLIIYFFLVNDQREGNFTIGKVLVYTTC